MLGLAVLVMSHAGYAKAEAPRDRASFDPDRTGPSRGLALGQLLVAVLGVLSITSEFFFGDDQGHARGRAAAADGARSQGRGARRGPGWPWGRSSRFAAFLAGQAAPGQSGRRAPPLPSPAWLRAVLMAGAYLCLMGLIGLGIGGHHPAHRRGDSRPSLASCFVVPTVFLAFPAGLQHGVEKFLPMIIAENSLTAVKPRGHRPCRPGPHWVCWPCTAVVTLARRRPGCSPAGTLARGQ